MCHSYCTDVSCSSGVLWITVASCSQSSSPVPWRRLTWVDGRVIIVNVLNLNALVWATRKCNRRGSGCCFDCAASIFAGIMKTEPAGADCYFHQEKLMHSLYSFPTMWLKPWHWFKGFTLNDWMKAQLRFCRQDDRSEEEPLPLSRQMNGWWFWRNHKGRKDCADYTKVLGGHNRTRETYTAWIGYDEMRWEDYPVNLWDKRLWRNNRHAQGVLLSLP